MSDTRVEVPGEAGDGRLERRTVLRGVAVGGVGLTALAACGSDDGSESESGGGGYGGGSGEPSESPTDNGGGNGNGGGGGGGTELGAVSDVPVGGGVVYGDEEVVVTQPTEGTFAAFSATCTHQGCTVGEVADGTINCPCHGSQFSIEDGSVVSGPASSPLPSESVTVQGQKLMLG